MALLINRYLNKVVHQSHENGSTRLNQFDRNSIAYFQCRFRQTLSENIIIGKSLQSGRFPDGNCPVFERMAESAFCITQTSASNGRRRRIRIHYSINIPVSGIGLMAFQNQIIRKNGSAASVGTDILHSGLVQRRQIGTLVIFYFSIVVSLSGSD